MTAVAHPLPAPPTRARSRARSRARPAATHLHLVRPTRPRPAQFRRRRTVVALAAAVLLGGGVAVGGLGGVPLTPPGPAPAVRPVPVAETSYVVRPGDTLWQIARALQPSGDVRPLVQRLAGQRAGAPLRVGERLVLPPD